MSERGVRHHTVKVPATTANLGPGFDAFGLALDLHLGARTDDRVAGTPRVTLTGEGADEVSDGDDNLLWTSFVAFCEERGVAVPDVAIRATNRIPLQRGLGSSSAAIVAGLVLARDLTGELVAETELVRIADRLEGHPDHVAPAIVGGLVAWARAGAGVPIGRRIEPAPTLAPVVLVPSGRQSTDEARAVLPATMTIAEVAEQSARAGHVLGALSGLWPADVAATVDLLHEPTRLAVMTASGEVIARLRAQGHHAWLSGAGPTVAVALEAGDAAAREAVIAIAGETGMVALVLDVDRSGAISCPDGGCALSGSGGCARCPRESV